MYHRSNTNVTVAFSSALALSLGLALSACSSNISDAMERSEPRAPSDSAPAATAQLETDEIVLAANGQNAAPLTTPDAGALDAGAELPPVAPPEGTTAPEAEEGPAPLVRVVAANGSGCAGQTPSVSAVTDDSFTLGFDGFTAELGADRTLARKNCIFAIEVTPPPGMTYAVTRVPFGGTANLQDGATGRAAIQYFYQGVSQTSTFGETLPTTVGDWSTNGEFAEDQVQVAPCSEVSLLLINTSIVINGEPGGAPSSLTVGPEVSVQLELEACE